MKDLLLPIARYNQIANEQMFEILEKQDTETLTRDAGSFFNSIIGLLNHILVSDLAWLTAFHSGSLSVPALDSPILDFEHPGFKSELYSSLADLGKHRGEVDDLLILLVENSPESLLTEEMKVTHASGRTLSLPFGAMLMHVLNHQTHHRGAVAQILDEQKVENDYSNLLYTMMD